MTGLVASQLVRTRFAPSPTGDLHLGGARTALFNYLYARAKNGKYILRVEDTDQERSAKKFEESILASLDWLGLEADESPKEGGPFGPYRQSERLERYQKYTQKLLEKGKAYPCFCTDEELKVKQEQAKVLGKPYIYDGKCCGLAAEEIEARKKNKESYTIRFLTESTEVRVEDMVQGTVKFDARLIGDFIIVKSNGFPSYNYAVVIDDYEMQISHVIRGVGHLSNTPRQILIHQALELPLPQYAHIAEIVGTDRKKLSKRSGADPVLMFRELGYLAPAFVNYMALLGWYPRDGVEFMPGQTLREKFDIEHCSKSPAMFDFFLAENKAGNKADSAKTKENVKERSENPGLNLENIQKSINKKSKLNWLNNFYLREMPLAELWPEEVRWLKRDPRLEALLNTDEAKLKHGFDATRKYLRSLAESVPYLKELFQEDQKIAEAEAQDFLKQELSTQVALAFLELVSQKKPQTPEDFSGLMQAVGQKTQAKGRSLYMPIRIAVTGSMEGLELPVLFSILGYERVAQRMKQNLA